MPETPNEVDVSQQPGSVISPGSASAASPISSVAEPTQQSSQETVTESLNEATPQPSLAEPVEETPISSDDSVVSNYDSNQDAQAQDYSAAESFSWTASEYVGHNKSGSWYGFYALAAAIIIGIVYFITRDLISIFALSFGAILLAFYAGRAPRDMQYSINMNGFSIGQKQHTFSQFRSYSVVHEGDSGSIVFMPLKRFAPLTTIYYSPAEEDPILDIIEQVLPFAEYRHDAIDRLMRQIRF